jgi:carbohydrate-selective porin OprB
MQPKLTSSTVGITDPTSGMHIEGFYRYRLGNNISITPGIIWLTAPNHNDTANPNDAFIGTIRTTFTF